MRPAFLNRPAAWTRTPRTAQSEIDAACAIERCLREKRSKFVDVLIGVMFVLTLIAFWADAL